MLGKAGGYRGGAGSEDNRQATSKDPHWPLLAPDRLPHPADAAEAGTHSLAHDVQKLKGGFHGSRDSSMQETERPEPHQLSEWAWLMLSLHF